MKTLRLTSVLFTTLALAACNGSSPSEPQSTLFNSPSADAAPGDSPDTSTVAPSTDASQQDALAQTCTLTVSTPNAACTACLGASCCLQANACLGASDCAALTDCIRACSADAGPQPVDAGDGQQACQFACVKAHHDSTGPAAQLDWCTKQECANVCP